MLLLESALRSSLLGLFVWALLKLLRVRDPDSETLVWTGVLGIALSMPLLNHYLPSLVVSVRAVPQQMAVFSAPGVHDTSLRLFWLTHHGQTYLIGTYALGLMICLTRLAIGLLQSFRLYTRAAPVEAEWAYGHHIRVNATLKTPASLARVILLPSDYREWSVAKRETVIAHEAAHIARGDFFIQLAASFHCVLFWFSPFAWWLQSKLAQVAETASDEVALQRLSDRITYAEILLEVASGSQRLPSVVAMAKGPFIQQRIERILSGAQCEHLSSPRRGLIMGSLLGVALALASAKAALAPIPSVALVEKAAPVKAAAEADSSSASLAEGPSARRIREHVHRAARAIPAIPDIAQSKGTKVSYNPRALLDLVDTPVRSQVPVSTVVHAGETFYMLSSDRPVADFSDENEGYLADH
jgi:hypothetical protein